MGSAFAFPDLSSATVLEFEEEGSATGVCVPVPGLDGDSPEASAFTRIRRPCSKMSSVRMAYNLTRNREPTKTYHWKKREATIGLVKRARTQNHGRMKVSGLGDSRYTKMRLTAMGETRRENSVAIRQRVRTTCSQTEDNSEDEESDLISMTHRKYALVPRRCVDSS